jgi:hypothetical protein
LGFGQEEVGGEVTEGKRPSKEEMEEAKEGREVGVEGGGVGMEERTGMEGRMEEKTGKLGEGRGVEEGNKTLLCLRSIWRSCKDKKSIPRIGWETADCKKLWTKVWLPNLSFLKTKFHEGMEAPLALTSFGPEGCWEEEKGRRLMAAPVSTKYEIWVLVSLRWMRGAPAVEGVAKKTAGATISFPAKCRGTGTS